MLMQHPVGLGDRIGSHQRIRWKFGRIRAGLLFDEIADSRGVDTGVKYEVHDVDILPPEFACHALGDRAGRKTWEIRSSATKERGRIALIESGSGTIVSSADLVEVMSPLRLSELSRYETKARFRSDEPIAKLPYKKTYAWVLKSVKRLRRPVPYEHPRGAVIWIRLKPRVIRHVKSGL